MCGFHRWIKNETARDTIELSNHMPSVDSMCLADFVRSNSSGGNPLDARNARLRANLQDTRTHADRGPNRGTN